MPTQARHRKPSSSLPAARSRPSVPAAGARHRRPQGTVSLAQPVAAPRPVTRGAPVRPPAAAPRSAAQPAGAAQPAAQRAAATRHRKPSALQGKPAKATAVTALAVSAAAGSAAATQWAAGTPAHPAATRVAAVSAPPANLPAADRRPPAAGPVGDPAALAGEPLVAIDHPGISLTTLPYPRPKGRHHRRPAVTVAVAAPTSTPSQAPPPSSAPYSNPLRAVTGLIPERVDMGVDFSGSGPVYPLGDAVITSATGNSSGWPGGGWITYRLTEGPDAGLMVYVAEDVQPTVSVGEAVTPSTVIANMYDGSVGIETGWAMPDAASAESQMPEAGGIGGNGPFPTMVGLSFENLLRSLGVPASPGAGGSGYGILPPGYPAA